MQIEKRWIIKSGNEFIGIDSASGGYFYLTNFWDCKKFASFEAANEYANTNWGSLKTGAWFIYECSDIDIKICEIQDPFEIELAALKKKHGKA